MLYAFLLAAASAPAPAPAIDPAALRALAEADTRLVGIGRRLAKGGAGLCRGAVSNPGWTIGDAEQYRPELRDEVRTGLRLGDYPTIVAVQPESAAAQAGVQAGDEIVAVGEALLPAASARASRARQASIETALFAGRREVTVRRQGQEVALTLAAEPGCASEFLIGRERGLRAASSDGARVVVSAEIIDFAANDDELALAAAHELAHNILGHNKGYAAQRAAGEDRSGARSRDRELEADRWALYLMARAGYDVSIAPGFWRRWGPKTGFGVFSDGTHPGWRERAKRAEAEIARIKAQQAAGQAPAP